MERKQIEQALDKFKDLKVAVVGDVMVDQYLWGEVERNSPEAPVSVVAVNKREKLLGGAANVAKNLKALGACPFLFSVVGDDSFGADFSTLMQKNQLAEDGIFVDETRKTTIKTRIFYEEKQVLRVDEETLDDISSHVEDKFFCEFVDVLSLQDVDLILFSDYDKGVLTASLIARIIDFARTKNILTAVDPKFKNFITYKGVDLFKPNFKEFCEGTANQIGKRDFETLSVVAEDFRKKQNIAELFITLSEEGVFICGENGIFRFPAEFRNIRDVSGAGDTVISVAGLAMAAGLSPRLVAFLSNIAGGLVCESVGVVSVSVEELKKEALNSLMPNN